jgi:hypothetical protein
MEVHCNGTARIRDHATGEVYEIESDELDWDAVGGDERQMGQEIHYQAMVEHAVLGELTWSLLSIRSVSKITMLQMPGLIR